MRGIKKASGEISGNMRDFIVAVLSFLLVLSLYFRAAFNSVELSYLGIGGCLGVASFARVVVFCIGFF